MKDSMQLSQEQRKRLQQLVSSGRATAREIQHAQVLLQSDEGVGGKRWTNAQISEAFGLHPSTIRRIRQRFLQAGLEAALGRARQPERPEKRKLDGETEAHLIALACSRAPTGRVRWTVRLLADRLVELGYVDAVSHQTIWNTLKKTN